MWTGRGFDDEDWPRFSPPAPLPPLSLLSVSEKNWTDFVACGAAAGIASAFGAPIGGVLLSLEEGASYWSTNLTWRAFFCAMITLGTLFVIGNEDSKWGQANLQKLFSLGEFTSIGDGSSNFSVWELFVFILIGCLGGLIGACFNAGCENMTLWRMKNVNHTKGRRVVEILIISFVCTIVSYVMPMLWGKCTELPTDMQDWTNQEKELVSNLVPFNCVPGKEYNEGELANTRLFSLPFLSFRMGGSLNSALFFCFSSFIFPPIQVASLYLTPADVAIRQLYHFRETGETDSSTFSSAALFLFFVPYITLAAVVFGTAVPAGLFVPSLLAGAAFGRLFGHLLHKLDHTSGTFADSGTYALIGRGFIMRIFLFRR